jgi:uncharacterized membrane protein
MMAGLTLAGAIHTVLAIAGIVVGLFQFLRPQGGPIHRARGYAFVYAMLIADGAAMLIFQFTGKFNILHIGAIVNLVCVAAAVIPVLRTPRPANWKNQHYHWTSWSYVGLLAAAATELVVRTSHLATREQAWMVTAATSALVTAIGYVLINRHRPVTGSQPSSGGVTIQHDGAPS